VSTLPVGAELMVERKENRRRKSVAVNGDTGEKRTERYIIERIPNVFQKFLRVNHWLSVRSFSVVADRPRATRPDIDAPSAKISSVIHQGLDARGTYQN